MMTGRTILAALAAMVLLVVAIGLVITFGIESGIIRTDSGKEKNENRKF